MRILTSTYLFIWFLVCVSRNVTVDDQLGDESTGRQVSYSGSWSQGSTCDSCLLKPDPSKVLDGTWHDSTYGGQAPGPYSFTILFDGDHF